MRGDGGRDDIVEFVMTVTKAEDNSTQRIEL